MNKIDIIQRSDEAKYQLKIEREDFTMEQNDFNVTLTWGFNGKKKVIPKENMFHDEEWNVFFMFDTSEMMGMVTAECEYFVPDTDSQYGYRREVDRQILCLVTDSSCPQVQKFCCKYVEPHNVTYIRRYHSDTNTLYAIVRVNGEVVRLKGGETLRVRKEIG